MKKYTFVYLFLALGLLPVMAPAAVILKGKTSSKVTAHVTRPNNLFVTDDKGGWFEQGLEMQQLGGWDTPYEVSARLRVVSTTGLFQVRMDEPLQIRNQANPALVFRTPVVRLGVEGGDLKPLMVGQGTEFRNPASPSEDEDSVGYYGLAISALPPDGNFKSTAGIYGGVLSLTFEPVAKAPE
ncbi:hypothetical protein GNF76_04935 [Pseudomonas sp. CCM 7893]|uniref:Fimbrial assembly protein n=1 Tax=Pseudomonas spelaei TaxID=1055469 RepID=A0A6I3WAD2_9PSED|nr:hypothetical protein [Pseudomonas spelaei]MUF03666.1 hypothetical protein [Pseudomonas spelaei]